MNLTRIARTTSAAVVAGVAGIASYSHMRVLAATNGQSDLLANLLPVSVDGMLIVSTVVMADDRAAGRRPRTSARVSFVVGVAASIVANVLAAPENLVARVISAWPAVALLLVVEMLSARGPAAPTGADETPAKTPAPSNGGRPSKAAKVAAAAAELPNGGKADIAAKAGVSQRTARRHLNGKESGRMTP